MEFFLMKKVFSDKEIVNPINPEEVFTCKDLVDGTFNHFTFRLQSVQKGKKVSNPKVIKVKKML